MDATTGENAPSALAEFRRGWPVLLAATLGSATGVSVLPFYTLGTFIGPLQAEFGWGRGAITTSYLYTTLVLAVAAPLLGVLADRFGVRRVSLLAIPLFAVGLLLLGAFQGSLLHFQLAFGLMGLLGAGATPVNYTRAVNAAFRRARGTALGISLAGIGVAAMLLPVLLSSINGTYGWRTGYLTLAVLALLPWPFVLLAFPRHRAAAGARGGAAAATALGRGTYWAMVLAFAAVAVAVSALIVHMVPLLRDAGLDAMGAARIASLVGVGVLVGRLAAGYLVDRFFAPLVAALFFAGAAAGCLLLAVGGVGLAPVAALAIGLSLGAEVDFMAFLTARYFGMSRYATNYGILYALFVLGGAVGPFLAGMSFDRSGNYAAVIWGVTALLLAAAAIMARLPRFSGTAEQPLAEVTDTHRYAR
ncbi:MFS transporter [Pararoseomonas indoligenes]|uniref:MFS transporter n=1 Tax=Roseomonas indoligenes TaxID=2820811 RepID=A0A940MXA9_9PROT|nr:MFS transporter [Pararoseomonas indoligenes]MBP0495109.1 MFS transporter [Pararoseomonas indoligenes]